MKTISKIIRALYLILFLITPLIFSFFNSELFELPKMYFVYLLTTTIVTLHLINWIRGQIPFFQKTFLDIPLILFLISQIICTLTSIDIHTSIYGYYSRLNGGLLSVISYLLLYWTLIPYLDDKFKSKIINFSLFSGFLVSLFGILEHFGVDKNLWVQDVQSRVFSTLGQPNWLAAFLDILLPFSFYQFLNSKKNISKIYFFLISCSFYLCLLFTKSKSGIIAGIISLIIFFVFDFFQNKNHRKLLIISSSLLIIFSLSINNPIKDILFPKKIDIRNSTPARPAGGLEINNLNITPSGDIRKIVWKGSLDLFKKFPIFGTGVETFAYSYYWTRPTEHNLTSEWDFLYNKAHNEYLNFLATTGLIGFTTYIFIIFSVLFYLIKNLIINSTLEIRHLSLAILCSYLSILITNAAGFSVVIVSLFFFLIPSLVSNTNNKNIKIHHSLNFLIPILILICLFITKKNISSYLADIFYAQSLSNDDKNQYAISYQEISQSVFLSPNEPIFLIQAGSLAAKLAVTTKNDQYIDQAISFSNKSVQISPANVNFWKERAQTYYYLATIDTKYFQYTVDSMLQAIKLAPTDAKLDYSLGQFLESANLVDDAIPYYQKAIELKSNYDYAYFSLSQIYFDQKKYDLAKKNLELTLQYAPTNTSAQDLLKKIK
jgi:O-antigen ligase